MSHDVWARGEAYERYVGRWSRRVASDFLAWTGVPADSRWLDLGCGTGALTATVLATAAPSAVLGVDTSAGFLAAARARTGGPGVHFVTGDARALPVADRSVDAAVSGLCLNFVPDPSLAVRELARVAAHHGLVACYVWDYAHGMEMLRHFWDAARSLDPRAAALDEGHRFLQFQPDGLRELWTDADLHDVEVRPLQVDTVFADFADFWEPFLGGQGPAPGYVATLPRPQRLALAAELDSRLPRGPHGTIPLRARVWAVQGRAR